MKNVATVTVREIKVQFNSTNNEVSQWARIRDAETGQILHTGRIPYIKRVAAQRYNVAVKAPKQGKLKIKLS